MRYIYKNALFLLLIFMSGIGYFFTSTETGLRTSINIISHSLPGKLQIETIHGKIFSRFKLENISYQDSNQQITISKFELSWNPWGLFRDKFIIEHLTLDNPTIHISHSNTNKKSPSNWLSAIILKEFEIHRLSLQYDDTHFEFDGGLKNTWNAAWHLDIPHIDHFYQFLNGSLTSTGTLSGPARTPKIIGELQGNNLAYDDKLIKKIDGKINLNLAPDTESEISLTAYDYKSTLKNLKKIDLNIAGHIARKNEALLANIDLTLMQDYKIISHITLPHFTQFTDLDQPILGKIDFNSSNLKLLTYVVPEISNPRAEIISNLIITGSLAKPVYKAVFDIKHGQITIPKLGITLANIDFHSENVSNHRVHYQGSFQSKKGMAKLDGIFDLAKSEASLTLKGDHLQAANLSEYEIVISPDLIVDYINNNVNIRGTISLPHASITPKNFSETITLPSETVFVDHPRKNVALPFTLTMQINLKIDDKIYIAYEDLQTYLSGNIQITGTPDSPATAFGELYSIDGKYRTFGKILKIQEGKLLFKGGPLLNPGLDIRATKDVKSVSVGSSGYFGKSTELGPIYSGTESITVGVLIKGTLDNPTVSLFSSPVGLSQNDILSYLLFGFPQSQASGKQSSMLLSAASALNMGGTSRLGNITEELQGTLGLTELNVESRDIFDPNTGKVESATSFVVGKQLAPNLYAHYSIGLFNPISIFNLRYQLSKRFAVQTETSSIDSGADLLYSIERD